MSEWQEIEGIGGLAALKTKPPLRLKEAVQPF